MTTLIHLHAPADASGLDAVLGTLTQSITIQVQRGTDSYYEWGEAANQYPDVDDTTHVVIAVDSDFAEHTYWAIANAGVLVDATLADDWCSHVTWGLGPEPNGWFSRYGHRISL